MLKTQLQVVFHVVILPGSPRRCVGLTGLPMYHGRLKNKGETTKTDTSPLVGQEDKRRETQAGKKGRITGKRDERGGAVTESWTQTDALRPQSQTLPINDGRFLFVCPAPQNNVQRECTQWQGHNKFVFVTCEIRLICKCHQDAGTVLVF